MIDDPFRMLLSYHYFRTINIHELLDDKFPTDPAPEVFADSGAYSALTQGAAIDVHEYGTWAARFQDRFRVIANLDVIGDGEHSAAGTWENQRILEDGYGLRPLPVFHAGEPWSALDRLLEHGYTYIALGGLVGRPAAAVMPWLVKCFKLAQGRVVYHGFGLTSWQAMSSLPWYSLDSSSWGSGYRYGLIRLYDDRSKRMVQIDIGHLRRGVYKYAYLIRALGFDPAILTVEHVDRTVLNRLSSAGWRHIEAMLRKRHGLIQLPKGVEEPTVHIRDADLAHSSIGVRLYAVDGSADNLIRGAGLRLYLADTTGRDTVAAAVHHNEREPTA